MSKSIFYDSAKVTRTDNINFRPSQVALSFPSLNLHSDGNELLVRRFISQLIIKNDDSWDVVFTQVSLEYYFAAPLSDAEKRSLSSMEFWGFVKDGYLTDKFFAELRIYRR